MMSVQQLLKGGKMKSMQMIYVLSLSLGLAACAGSSGSSGGGGNAAVDGNGNCTSETIALHNEIKNNSDRFKTSGYKDMDSLKSIQNACVRLKGILGDKSCGAVNDSTKENVTYSFSDAKPVCDQADKILSAVAKTPSPAEQSSKPDVTDVNGAKVLANGFSVKLKNPSIEKDLIGTDVDPIFVQKGKILSTPSEISPTGGPVCFINKAKDYKGISQSGVIVFDILVKDDGEQFIIGSDREMALACLKKGKTSKWTVGDLKAAFGDLLEVKVK